MATTYKTPGVYVEEITKFPPSVAQVETAIPAFIGYTEKAVNNAGESLTNVPTRIVSLLEYENNFGKAMAEDITVVIRDFYVRDTTTTPVSLKLDKRTIDPAITSPKKNTLYYHMQMYFANGGGPCYICSVGTAANAVSKTDLQAGLDAVKKYDEPTLILMPEGVNLTTAGDLYDLYDLGLAQAELLGDRFVMMDIHGDNASTLRDGTTGIGSNSLKYGAAYHPWLKTSLSVYYTDASVTIDHKKDVTNATTILNTPDGDFDDTGETVSYGTLNKLGDVLTDTANKNDQLYKAIKEEITNKLRVTLPPCSSVAGIYAYVDSTRGVWKAPANVSLGFTNGLTKNITDEDQKDLNVDVTGGKSINCIRAFTGRGVLVWGARTLAGNDNEWRYIPVRRLFNMVEESVKKASTQFVFEPNDANTWTRIRAMIENYLTILWRQGALAGAKPEHAFYVACGLGSTMTAQDILEGRMIIEIGMAAVRPAEFIILRFSHKMQES
jgi:uncharacterized protein